MRILWTAVALTTALLQTQLASIASKADGVVGITAVDMETGRRVSINGSERFPMASVVKLPVAIAFLPRIDRGEESLTREVTISPADFVRGVSPIRDEAKGKPITVTMGRVFDAMARESDNTAVDYIFKSVPPSEVMRVLRALKVEGINVSRPEGKVFDELPQRADDPRDTATPDGMADLLTRLYKHKAGLSAESEEILLRAMRETETGPHRLRGNLPADVLVAHKTGSMPGTLNDVGILTSADGKHHIAIAAFTKGAKPDQESRQEAVIAEIARAVYDAFTASPAQASTN